MNSLWHSKSKWPILIVSLTFWLALLGVTGTLTSGYHFTDDHGFFHEGHSVAGTTIGNELRVLKNEILRPKLRFRPVFQMHRRWAILAMGKNFTAWSVYYALLAAATSFLLFLFMTGTGFSSMESLLFTSLTLLGHQAAVWWKLGSNETIGLLMLALTLFFMGKSANAAEPRHKNRYNVLFVGFALLTSWSKESFILVLPALVFWKIWLCRREGKTTVSEALKENRVTGAALLALFAAELLHVTLNLDTAGVGYAGYEGFRFSLFFKTALQAFMAAHGWVLIPMLAIIAAIWRREPGKYLNRLLPPLILAGLILVPQVALYMKSGMTERYLLPGVMGLTFLMVALLRHIRLDTPAKGFLRLPFSKTETVAILLLCLALLMQLRVTRYTAIAFARDGQHTNAWLQSIGEHTQPGEPLLVITHMHRFYEPSISLKKYLAFQMNRKHTLFAPVSLDIKPTRHPFWKFLNREFRERFPGFPTAHETLRERFPTILVFPRLETKFLHSAASWFDPSKYNRYANDGGFVSFYKIGATKDTKKHEEQEKEQ